MNLNVRNRTDLGWLAICMTPNLRLQVARLASLSTHRDRKTMLHQAKILIVEDEAMIAMHLAIIIEDHDGQVIGPATSVAEALEMIVAGAVIEGAILDGNLGDGDVTPVALKLIANGVPVVIYSGVGVPLDLAAIYPNLPIILKPSAATQAVNLLAASIVCCRN